MRRRRFLQSLLAVLGSVAFASLFYPLLRFLAPPGTEARIKRASFPKADLPVGAAKSVILQNNPAIVVNRPGKGLVAFSRVCTHLGCLIEYDRDKNRLICPCHAGIFDLDGNVLSGPPPKALPKLPVRVEGEMIVIG